MRTRPTGANLNYTIAMLHHRPPRGGGIALRLTWAWCIPRVLVMSGFSDPNAMATVGENIAETEPAIATPGESDMGSSPPNATGGIP